MKINNIILVLRTRIILLSSFVIYFFCICHSGRFPIISANFFVFSTFGLKFIWHQLILLNGFGTPGHIFCLLLPEKACKIMITYNIWLVPKILKHMVPVITNTFYLKLINFSYTICLDLQYA